MSLDSDNYTALGGGSGGGLPDMGSSADIQTKNIGTDHFEQGKKFTNIFAPTTPTP